MEKHQERKSALPIPLESGKHFVTWTTFLPCWHVFIWDADNNQPHFSSNAKGAKTI